MASKTIITCDKCKKEIKEYQIIEVGDYNYNSTMFKKRDYELCIPCFDDMIKMLS